MAMPSSYKLQNTRSWHAVVIGRLSCHVVYLYEINCESRVHNGEELVILDVEFSPQEMISFWGPSKMLRLS